MAANEGALTAYKQMVREQEEEDRRRIAERNAQTLRVPRGRA